MKSLKFLLPALLLSLSVPAAEPECFPEEVLPDNAFPTVKIETSMGDIVIELNRMRAPVSVNNFLRYVLAGEYDGTIFHRVMPGFVVQGGGYTETIEERELFAPIINESGNGLKNLPMTVAMARFDDPHAGADVEAQEQVANVLGEHDLRANFQLSLQQFHFYHAQQGHHGNGTAAHGCDHARARRVAPGRGGHR